MAYQRKEEEDPYVWPGTSILRNLAGLRDEATLQNFETAVSVFRQAELLARPVPGGFDLRHLKAIHRHLFQDVYSWAGELRSVDIAKGGTRFGSHQFIEEYARKVFATLQRERELWSRAPQLVDLPARLAEYLGELNAMHPFREGNGRTQRAFVSQLAAVYNLRIRWGKITQTEMIEASISSFNGNNEFLALLIRENIEPCPAF